MATNPAASLKQGQQYIQNAKDAISQEAQINSDSTLLNTGLSVQEGAINDSDDNKLMPVFSAYAMGRSNGAVDAPRHVSIVNQDPSSHQFVGNDAIWWTFMEVKPEEGESNENPNYLVDADGDGEVDFGVGTNGGVVNSIYEIDPNGELITYEDTDGNGQIDRRIVQSFDEYGNEELIIQRDYNEDGIVEGTYYDPNTSSVGGEVYLDDHNQDGVPEAQVSLSINDQGDQEVTLVVDHDKDASTPDMIATGVLKEDGSYENLKIADENGQLDPDLDSSVEAFDTTRGLFENAVPFVTEHIAEEAITRPDSGLDLFRSEATVSGPPGSSEPDTSGGGGEEGSDALIVGNGSNGGYKGHNYGASVDTDGGSKGGRFSNGNFTGGANVAPAVGPDFTSNVEEEGVEGSTETVILGDATEGEHGSASYAVYKGKAEGSASANVSGTGVKAAGSGIVEANVVEGEARYGKEGDVFTTGAKGTVGTSAQGHGSLSASPVDGIQGAAEGGAFVGTRVAADAEVDTVGVGAKGSATASAGLGASGSITGGIGPDGITFGGKLGLTLGIGGEISWQIKIDPGELAEPVFGPLIDDISGPIADQFHERSGVDQPQGEELPVTMDGVTFVPPRGWTPADGVPSYVPTEPAEVFTVPVAEPEVTITPLDEVTGPRQGDGVADPFGPY